MATGGLTSRISPDSQTPGAAQQATPTGTPIAISHRPADGVIDEKDLAVLCDNWLATLTSELVMPGATIQQVYSARKYILRRPNLGPEQQ